MFVIAARGYPLGKLAQSLDGIRHHHLWREDFVIPPRNLQEAMPVKRLQKKAMPRIGCDRERLVDSVV
jgi:hypothetical protein